MGDPLYPFHNAKNESNTFMENLNTTKKCTTILIYIYNNTSDVYLYDIFILKLSVMRTLLLSICFIWSTETVVVGILYKDIHKLLPDKSQYYLDGYVLGTIGINISIFVQFCLFFNFCISD